MDMVVSFAGVKGGVFVEVTVQFNQRSTNAIVFKKGPQERFSTCRIGFADRASRIGLPAIFCIA